MSPYYRPPKWIPEDMEYPPDTCPICIKLIQEYQKKGLPIPNYVCCAYGHWLIDFPEKCKAPEELPVWAWTRPIRDKNGLPLQKEE